MPITTTKVPSSHQVMTRETDRAITWWLLGTFVVVMGIAVGIGLLTGQLIYFIILGVPFAVLAVLLILVRRTEAAAYSRIEGQPGASLSALHTIRRGWEFPDEPVAMDPRTQDLVSSSFTHLRAHETDSYLVCRLLLEK